MNLCHRLVVVGTACVVYNKFSKSTPYYSQYIGLDYIHSSYCENLVDSPMSNPKKLIFSTVYFRHGTRTPLTQLKHFPDLVWNEALCDVDTSEAYLPYKVFNQHDGSDSRPPSFFDGRYKSIKLPGGCNAGQLTKKGQQLSYDLGKKLKERYIEQFNLFDGKYNPDLVGSYSTNMDRTIHSMQAVLKGLFEDSINQENMAVIRTRPNQVDYNFPNYFFSEKVNKWMGYAYSAQYSLRVCDELREKLTQILHNSSDLPPPISLWDSLISMKSNGFEIPPEYEEIYSLVEKCAAHAEKFAVCGDNPANMKTLFGKVVDDIITHMENAVKHHDKTECDGEYFKLWLTSCHDTTIITLLTAMGGFNEKWPPLSSYIAFELHRDTTDNNNYVRVIFNGDVVRSGGCDPEGFIKLEEFAVKHDKIRLRQLDDDHFLPYPVPN